jgi:ABC-2 type transport system ATP-binding protein
MSTATLSEGSGQQARESQWAVETHGLTKRFGENVAVNGVELLIPRGCAFGYLGPNGAGKTTLIRVLLGLTHADAGTMSLLGYAVPRHRDAALARVGAIVDEPRFHGHLTGRQNLQLLAAARERAARDRIDPSLERVGILHRADDRVSKYSMGMRQRLGVAACLIGDPQLLILDEPMNGLDPAGMQDMREMILSLVAEGRTVVLSSHLLDEVERTCDAVAIVDRGNVIRQGPISELLAGASLVLEVDCSDPDRARALVAATAIGAADGAEATVEPTGLGVTLPAGTGLDVVAEVNRVLVDGGISVYRLQVVQASLESWFLQVTSRLGESP